MSDPHYVQNTVLAVVCVCVCVCVCNKHEHTSTPKEILIKEYYKILEKILEDLIY